MTKRPAKRAFPVDRHLVICPRLAYLPCSISAMQHPDKNADDPEATKKFQALSWIHSFLSDPEKRKVYDETVSSL